MKELSMRQLEGFHTTWEVWVETFLSVVGIVLIGVGGSGMSGKIKEEAGWAFQG
jgi:uncharacterized membrane protein